MKNKTFILLIILIRAFLLIACDNATNLNNSQETVDSCYKIATTKNTNSDQSVLAESSDIIGKIKNKAKELDGEVIQYIYDTENSDNALAVIEHSDSIYEYWFFTKSTSKLIMSKQILMSDCIVHKEKNQEFIIIYEYVVGKGFPSNIVTILDSKPQIISEYSDEIDDKTLYYEPEEDVVCKRIGGETIGDSTIIPYYWDIKCSAFKEKTITTSESTTIPESTEPIVTTTIPKEKLTEVEQKLLDLSDKEISEYTEDDFIFMLNTDLSCYIRPFSLNSSESLMWWRINGSCFSYYIFPTKLCKSITIYTSGGYSGEDYEIKIKDQQGTPMMISIDFEYGDITYDDVVLEKFI